MIKKRRMIQTIFGMPDTTNSYGRGKTLTGCNFGFKLQVAFLLKYRNDVFCKVGMRRWEEVCGQNSKNRRDREAVQSKVAIAAKSIDRLMASPWNSAVELCRGSRGTVSSKPSLGTTHNQKC